MDPEIQELKELVEKNIKMTEDTNRIVHKLRRNIWWGRLWTIVWWALVLGVSSVTYYVYLQPYVDQATRAYGSTKNFEQQVQNFFTQFAHMGTTTTK